MSLFAPIPSVIENSSFEALEWGRLQELVAGFARSQVARGWLLALRPSRDASWIAGEHALVDEMRLLLKDGAAPPLVGLFDPSRMVSKARIPGASLEAEEIRDLLLLLDSITAWQAFVEQPPESLALPGLQALSRLPAGAQLGRLLHSLRSRMNPDGSLADNASADLKRIRKEIERQQRVIEESLRSSLRRLSQGGETQEDLITIRGERFVIPVKAEFKRRIPGVVHGASSSGQTVYLEPLETIEQNNELVRLMEEELAETRRIYQAMTREIGVEGHAIAEGAASLARLDTLEARARLAAEFDCVRPQFADPGAPGLSLEQARHPLLERRLRHQAGGGAEAHASGAGRGASIVPLTLALNDQERQLIISGPNTGGKTVALKTAGLLSMMAQAGIPVPAREAVFPLFDAFLADIGDAQSIEQNLSTFSAHIVNLNRIAQLADDSSLVLLDELGSATDPEEGAALAVAIAGHFLERKAWCLISTHHTSLKVYAAKRAGVLNAAVGFDERTLEPTYELRLGIPGASAGINIAQRLGLDPKILEEARGQLNSQTRDISYFLDQLHAQLDAAAAERTALRLREQEVAREKSRLDAEGLKEWRAKVRDLEEKLQLLLKDFAYRVRETIAAIDDRTAQQKLSKDAERRMARLRREFSEQFNAAVAAQHSGADRGDSNAQPHLVRHVAVGDTVKLKSLGKSGRVLRQLEGDAFEVAVGAMKMRVSRGDIAELLAPAQPVAVNPVTAAARQRGVSISVASHDAMRPEINVIGRTVEEATEEVDQFLDRAFLAGMPRVRIVHGMGMGILRKALRERLKHHPHVAQIAEAGQSEGGAGATVVDLDL
ncbi:MAG TPA: Smr/MutS family protein [Acidobacteriaceae bacterium]|nr:Smr/MutS family protein [Acidobacteriaceae bacterium]